MERSFLKLEGETFFFLCTCKGVSYLGRLEFWTNSKAKKRRKRNIIEMINSMLRMKERLRWRRRRGGESINTMNPAIWGLT
jgi:hypothetical protein